MAPPLVSAASRAPRRARSRPLTASWWRWAPRRPRPVWMPQDDQLHHLVEVLPRQAGVRGRPGGPARTAASTSHSSVAATSATSCWASTSSGATGGCEQVELAGPHGGQQRRALDQLVAGHRVEAAGRGAVELVVGPARPAGGRCRWPAGEPIWHTSSTGPDVDAQLERGRGHEGPEVAGPQALFRRCAGGPPRGCRDGRPPAGRRRRSDRPSAASPDSCPSSSPSRSASWWATRSAILRVLTKTSVVRWSSTCAGDAVEDVGQLAAAGHRLELAVGQLDGHVEIPRVAAVDDGGGRAGRSCTPESRRATTSSGRWVAERPMRWRRPPLAATSWSSRSRLRARWRPACPGPGCAPRRRSRCARRRSTARDDGAVSRR